MNTSPQVMLALLRHLVNVVGVNQTDISIGDPVCLFANEYYTPLHDEFPNVRYLDHLGKFGRTRPQPSDVNFYFSNRLPGYTQDRILAPFAEATYFINLANFKSHQSAGVTLCGKNYYGFLRLPTEGGYYSLHDSLPQYDTAMSRYRCMVDLMGHAHSGGKALLYLIDGLYAGQHPNEFTPRKWLTAPFNNDWTSSLFVSQDPVAIDSVAYDFLWSEPTWATITHMAAGDDYLHEAALANNPPSGTFYDPDHATATMRMASLGVHEHWNNATDKQYSRNLGTGNGIELIKGGWPVAVISAAPMAGKAPLEVSFDGSASYDTDPAGSIDHYQWDFDSDGTIDATGPIAGHLYTTAGDHFASLTVVDNEGLSHTARVRIAIERQAGDSDADYDVDQADFGFLQACMAGTGNMVSGECVHADLDHDGDVDSGDVARFMDCMSGPEEPADPACAP